MHKTLSSREVVSVLVEDGFAFVSQRGSHAKYRKITHGEVRTVIVPMNKKEIPVGTLRSILRQSQLLKESFFGEA